MSQRELDARSEFQKSHSPFRLKQSDCPEFIASRKYYHQTRSKEKGEAKQTRTKLSPIICGSKLKIESLPKEEGVQRHKSAKLPLKIAKLCPRTGSLHKRRGLENA